MPQDEQIGNERQVNTFDANGNLTGQIVTKSDSSADYTISNQYDAAGNLSQYSLNNQSGTAYTNTYTYNYSSQRLFDNYQVNSVQGSPSINQPGTTTNSYDVNGNLTGVTDSTQAANDRTFVNDAQGHVLYISQRQPGVCGECHNESRTWR